MIHDTCDYCRREFGWTDKPICMNCGLENVRPSPPVIETAMLAPPENAMIKRPTSRKPRRKRESR